MDVAELGALVGVEPHELTRIEAGHVVPAEPLVLALARALAVPRDELAPQHAEPGLDYVDAAASHAGPVSPESARRIAYILRPPSLAGCP